MFATKLNRKLGNEVKSYSRNANILKKGWSLKQEQEKKLNRKEQESHVFGRKEDKRKKRGEGG